MNIEDIHEDADFLKSPAGLFIAGRFLNPDDPPVRRRDDQTSIFRRRPLRIAKEPDDKGGHTQKNKANPIEAGNESDDRCPCKRDDEGKTFANNVAAVIAVVRQNARLP